MEIILSTIKELLMLVCALIRVATVSLPIIGVMKLDTTFLLMFLLRIT